MGLREDGSRPLKWDAPIAGYQDNFILEVLLEQYKYGRNP
jgi:hypothetical protein